MREAAFRQEVTAAAVLIPVALVLPASLYEQAALIGSLFLIVMTELINSSFEAVVDLVSLNQHPLAAVAKDAGSAAVLIAIMLAAGIWFVVLLSVF